MDHSDLHVIDLGNYGSLRLTCTRSIYVIMDHSDLHVLGLGNYGSLTYKY